MTAEEYLNQHPMTSHWHDEKTKEMVCFAEDTEAMMIEFARLHVEAALKAAAKNADLIETDGDVDRETILKAYPLTNIK